MRTLLFLTLLSVQLCFGQKVNDLMKYSVMEFDSAVVTLGKTAVKQDTSEFGITFYYDSRITTITQSEIGNNNIITDVHSNVFAHWKNFIDMMNDSQFKLVHIDETEFGKLLTYESVFSIVSLGYNEEEKKFVSIVLMK